jgi:phosphoserine phosphatase
MDPNIKHTWNTEPASPLPLNDLRIAFLDIDGTIKSFSDPYGYLHKELGTWHVAQKYEKLYKEGKINSDDWAKLDAQLWKGYKEEYISSLLSLIPWVPGAQQLLNILSTMQISIALISSGINLHADPIATKWKAEYCYSNKLKTQAGRLTGEIEIIVPTDKKGDLVNSIMSEKKARPNECIALGDSTSDIAMFQRVGWSVAVAPRDNLTMQHATIVLRSPDLTPLLPLFKGQQD